MAKMQQRDVLLSSAARWSRAGKVDHDNDRSMRPRNHHRDGLAAYRSAGSKSTNNAPGSNAMLRLQNVLGRS